MDKPQASPAIDNASWAETLGERLQNGPVESLLLSTTERYRLVAKARWFFLAFVAIYGVGAGLGYLYSDYGWFLTPSQGIGMLMGQNGINSARMQFGRESEGGRAMSIVSVDSPVSEAVLEKVRKLPNVLSVKLIRI